MFIRSVLLREVRLFRDQAVDLTGGLNLLVGANNTGKSTVLDACALAAPVGSPRIAMPGEPTAASRADVQIRVCLHGDELREFAESCDWICMPGGVGLEPIQVMEVFDRWLATLAEVEVSWTLFEGGGVEPGDPTFGLYPLASVAKGPVTIGVARDGDRRWLKAQPGATAENLLARRLLDWCRSRVVRLQADRRPQRQFENPEAVLRDDASNLAGVLERLQQQPQKLARFQELLRTVLPEVQQVTVKRERATGEVFVWFHDPAPGEDRHAIPLARCGSGMAHILAMLVTLSQVQPRGVLIIDEPQAYVHPGALSRLLDAALSTKAGQIVVATHSPQLVNRPDVNNIVELRLEKSNPVVTQLDHRRLADVQRVLATLGARPTEVFLAGSVLWVEGPSERNVFGVLQRSIAQRPDAGNLRRLCGTLALGVAHTDRLVAKDRDHLVGELMALYATVAGSHSLLPPRCGFLLDRDDRSLTARKKAYNGRRKFVAFTMKQMLENYLIDADVILTVLRRLVPADITDLTIDDDLVHSMCANFDVVDGHGARLLDAIFEDATGKRMKYRKTDYAHLLAAELLARDATALDDLAKQALACLDGLAEEPSE